VGNCARAVREGGGKRILARGNDAWVESWLPIATATYPRGKQTRLGLPSPTVYGCPRLSPTARLDLHTFLPLLLRHHLQFFPLHCRRILRTYHSGAAGHSHLGHHPEFASTSFPSTPTNLMFTYPGKTCS
jgi:hypothetical protein